MKRPRKSLGSLIKQEIVSRFEGVVKNEIDEFNHAKSSTDSRCAKLEEELLALREEIKNVREEARNKSNKVVDIFLSEKKALEDSFEEQRRYMKTNVLECQKHIKEFDEHVDCFVKKNNLDFILQAIGKVIETLQLEQHRIQKETNSSIENKKAESLEYCDQKHKEISKHFDQVCHVLKTYENKLEEYKVNNDGVSKELLAYKKDVFILQKKVEDLYTQLDRIVKGR